MVLAAYGKFREVVYDTQGILDDGSDVVVRLPPIENEPYPRLICFQAKSFDDLSKPNYMQELKAQRDDTMRKVKGLEYYLLLLCTDMHAHKPRVRNVMAEFRSAALTEVIEPAFAYTFLHHSMTRIDAFVKRSVEAEDFVFKEALHELGAYDGPSQRALVVYLAVKSVVAGMLIFDNDMLQSSSTLHSAYSELRQKQAKLLDQRSEDSQRKIDKDDRDKEDDDWNVQTVQIADFQEQLAIDLEALESGVLASVAGSQSTRFLGDQVKAVNAVIANALARYDYNESQLMSYMFDVMGVLD